ncbi:hypothetical protein [Leucobacter sp. W1478]|uniref:baeRF11 domain-containing protein n=1 Tax=Leucobacter sp. W1478 TaxID=3439065 RepID=UPI003F38BEB7
MKVTIPNDTELAELIEHRNPASVTIYLPSSPRPTETEHVQLALRNAAASADAELASADADKASRRSIAGALDALQTDREFWESQAHSVAIFACPERVRVFHTANRLVDLVAVGDRFDVGPLLRSRSFPGEGYVLTVSQGSVHLYELRADQRATEVDIDTLPDDLSEVLRQEPHGGQADRISDTGALGPKIQQKKYCSLIQESILPLLGDTNVPLILCATDDLDTAYRAINSYQGLVDGGIAAHPDSLSATDLDREARSILDALYADEMVEWKERFENLRGEGKAVSQLTEVARAATAGAVSELLFDMDDTSTEGTIDEAGAIDFASERGPATVGLLGEMAARVLRSGGKVLAVRKEDLPDDSPVAAILRYPPVG